MVYFFHHSTFRLQLQRITSARILPKIGAGLLCALQNELLRFHTAVDHHPHQQLPRCHSMMVSGVFQLVGQLNDLLFRCRCSMACFCGLPVGASPMVCSACRCSRTPAPSRGKYRAVRSFPRHRLRGSRSAFPGLPGQGSARSCGSPPPAPTNSRMPRIQCTVCISGSAAAPGSA